jgi:diguanylate cyclase (GGDEF)-like protein
LTNIWKALQDPLRDSIHAILKSGKVETPQTTVKAEEAPKLEKKAVDHPEFKFAEEKITPLPPKAFPAPAPKHEEKSTKRKRPVVRVDEVTRLFNKDYFEECLAIEVERAKRYSRSVSILFLSVSPASGHPASSGMDGVATQVAEILNKSLRQVDIICRLEKDKYGIILPDTSNQTYGVIAKRVFRFFKEVMGEAPPVFLNISASTYPKHAGNHLLLFENAEKLLAQAKEVGPNKAVLPE